MHKIENERHKIVWEFEIQADLQIMWGGCPRGVIVKALDCGIVVNEFELQSRDNVHFKTNSLGKGMKPLILPAMG